MSYVKPLDPPVPLTIPHMTPLHHEHPGTTACNDADSRAMVRTRVHRLARAAPVEAQARAEGPTGLASPLESHPLGPRYWQAVAVLPHAARRPWQTS